MSERNEYDEHNGQTEAAEQSRPEYVDFTVDDFPAGWPHVWRPSLWSPTSHRL